MMGLIGLIIVVIVLVTPGEQTLMALLGGALFGVAVVRLFTDHD